MRSDSMKAFVKMLSVFITVLMIMGVASVGMSAFAVSDDVIGDYDFKITSPYDDIDWSTIKTYKAATHVHTVRSDGDVELNDMIREYYKLGYDALSLTDHGTINYSWMDGGHRLTWFDYQYFVHGNVDELGSEEYNAIVTGTKPVDGTPRGYGMTEVPYGIELNGASTNKCHINSYYADVGHGDLEMNTSWPESAVVKSYNGNGFTHINHVGEWAEGNDSALVYNESWLERFTSIYQTYCPNREGWDKGERGVVGMELVNTADSRTKNDRRYVYDEILKRLAPQGINVYGFCEDDAHEYSDCDRNAQFLLMDDNSNTQMSGVTFNGKQLTVGQNNVRNSMFYGRFYCSAKNAKNSYELGNGFAAQGAYPSISNISVDSKTNQIKITCKDATKARLVADGVIIETKKVSASGSTVVFDLNAYEEKINSYVRVYFTGDGGITFLQPFLVEKTESKQASVQFITPSSDTDVKVYNASGTLVTSEYADNYYILPAGNYTYTAKRNGYLPKTDSFTVTQSDITNGVKKKINVELEEDSDVTFAYFYAPETIYLSKDDNQSFQYYIDRENAVNGALNAQSNKTTGNIFFSREGATNVSLTYSVEEGAASVNHINLGVTNTAEGTLSTQVSGGQLSQALTNGEYVLIKWTATYTYKDITYYSYTYSYVYKTPTGTTSTLAAGAFAETTKNITTWPHAKMRVVASVYVFGLHSITTNNANGYEYAPYSGTELTKADSNPKVTGSGYAWNDRSSSGGSEVTNTTGDVGNLYADRSRVNNFSQIPNLMIGFDLNDSTQTEDYSDGVGTSFYFGDDSVAANCVYKFTCDADNHNIYTKYNNGNTYTVTTAGHGKYKLSMHSGQRLYQSNNSVDAKKLNFPLPAASHSETEIPVIGNAKGAKSGRTDTVQMKVFINVVNVNKNDLRAKLNDSIKVSYQKNWFSSASDWDAYQKAVVEAAKILGNPGADGEAISDATNKLEDAEGAIKLKTGTAVVKHYWTYGDNTGLIYSEDSYTYTYNDNLAANAVEINGYTFASQFECYANGVLIDSGIESFDNAAAAAENYEWRFYYVPNSYSVSYETGTGESFSPNTGSGSTANFGQTYEITSNYPSRTGYTFDGWYLDAADKTYSSSEKIKWDWSSDGIFTAQWKALKYNVTYDVNGGDSSFKPASSYLTATYGETYLMPSEVPTKTGYMFMGWKLNDGDSYTAGGQFMWKVASDGEFVAQWTNALYTVTFDPVASDATVTPATKQVEFDKAYGTLAKAERTGYTATWYSNPDYTSSSLVKDTTLVKIAADHKLYAKWNPTEYTIKYDLGGGTVTGSNPYKYTIESAAFTLKNPTRTGYEFEGWSGTGISASAYSKSVTVATGSYGNRTYTAHWKAIDYKIDYTLNGGTNDSRNPSSYTYDNYVTIYPATRTGYNFTGWTGSGVTDTATVTISKGSTGDRSYSAGWSIINYKITYDLAGGSESAANPTSYNIESADIKLNAPVKTGYTFAGWKSNYYNGTVLNVTIAKGSYGNKAFTAVWSNNGYVITYDLAGGSVDGSNPNGYNTGDTITLINPVKEGYTFAGWIKKDLESGIESDPAMTSGITSSDHGNKNFTATWAPKTYTISYVLDGGKFETVQGNPTSYTPDSEAIVLVTPVKAGYRFTGWSGTGLGGNVTKVTIPSGSIGNREYTAHWATMVYSISYDLAGGTDTGLPTQYTVDDTQTIGAPLRTGYTFAGWSQSYESFTWKSTYADPSTGYLGSNSSYPDSIYSSPIVLRSGKTYSLSTASSGGISDLKLLTYNLDGTFKAAVNTVNFTPSADCIGYILAYKGHTNQSIIDSVKLSVSGQQSTVAIAKGSTGNMKLTASWNVNTYTLTYDLDGGTLSEENPATYTAETDTFTLHNPTKTGYDFVGWLYDGNTSSSVTIAKGSTGNRTYKAVWNETVYSITYNLGGGSVSGNPVSYTKDTATFTLNNPTRTGYSFSGWTGTGISGVTATVTVPKGSLGNRTYTATWTPTTYTITYNLDGGTNSALNPRSYTVETDTFTLAYPTKSGAVFAGWTGTDIDGVSANVTISKGSTGNRTYTATWDISTFTISYNLNGGIGDASNPTSYSVDSDPITLARPSRTGYRFLGWTGTGLSGVTEYVTIPTGSTGHRSYTAIWSAIDYTISYTLGTGAQLDEENPTTYNVETTTFTLNNPVRAGYVFTGWTGTDLNSLTATVTIAKGSTGNRTYTANWSVDGYAISYVLNGGKLSAENPATYTITSPDITLNNPTREGYKFTGWSGTGISGTGLSTSVTIPTGSTGNRNYEANWELEVYNLTYHLDGGTQTVANPSTYTYLSAPITLYSPVKAGYSFLGWSSDYFDDVQMSVTIPTNSTGDKEFVAHWQLGVYTIKYNLNGGTVSGTNPTTFRYSTDSFTLINPTKKGYVFAGWSGTGISGTTMTVEIPKGSSGDREYTANWSESSNIITYNLNGGVITDGSNPTSYVTNSGMITLINPTKLGYTFTGWSGTGISGTSTKVSFDTTGGGSKSFTANWTAINYRIAYNLNGGTLATANPRFYTVEDSITLNNPTRTGYLFKGWEGTGLEEGFTYQTVNIVKGSTGNRTYTAVWGETVYTITYNYNGGSTDYANPTSYTISSSAITLYNPERTGYTFTGWTGTDYSNPTKNAVIPSGSTGNKTFTANFSVITYSISYFGVDNAKFTPSAVSYTVDSDAITLPAPTRIGYTFLGWRGTGIVGISKDVTIAKGSTGDRTYTAQWKPISFSITYNLNGGKTSGDNPTSYTSEDSKISILNPGKAGYGFGGWTQSYENFTWSNGFINASTGAVESSSTYPNSKYAAPIVLRKGVTYTVSGVSADLLRWRLFSLDGTYLNSQTASSYTPTADCIVYILAYSGLTEAQLGAIKLTVNGKLTNASIPTGSMGNVTFTANWTSQKYTISYNGLDGATVSGNPTSYTADQTITLKNPTKTGYTFLGWTGTDLLSASTNVTIPAGSSGNRVYTAQWKLTDYSISISLNGGTISGYMPTSYNVNSSAITLPTPKKSGYRFLGWSGTDITGTASSVTIAAGSTGNRAYTANWEENTSGTHVFRFYGYNKQLFYSKEVAVGEKFELPKDAIIGYDVKAWSIDYTLPQYVNSVDDVDVYAVSFTPTSSKKYKITVNDTETTYGQYDTVTITAPATNSSGQAFSYWEDGSGKIVSYYRSYSFKAHANEKLIPQYGKSFSGVKAAIRVTKIEYNRYYDWITVYAERSVSSEYTVLQHGIIFTDNASVAADTSRFVIGTSGVKASTAKGRNKSGIYTLSISHLENYGDYIYARGYVKVADADGNVSIIYSDVSEKFYNYHKNPSSYQG